MAIDVDKLIADAQAARAAAKAQKAEADKAAAALKASKEANKSVNAKVANQLNYANALSETITEIEGKLTAYAISIGRGDELGPGEQKEFDKLLKQYKSADKTYKKTIEDANAVLATAPSPTKVSVSRGRARIAPTAEEIAVTEEEGPQGTGNTAATVDKINKQLDILNKKPREFIYGLKPQERINLAKTLTDAGYQTPDLNGEFNDGLVANYKLAINNAKSWNLSNKDLPDYVPVDLTGFLTYRTRLTGAAGGEGGTGRPNQWGTISNATQAKSVINSVATNILGREATNKEVASITKKLVAAQKANPYRDVNGMTVGGVDAEQFVTDIFKAGEEYSSKKQTQQDLLQNQIQETLNANGISYKPAQAKAYADRIKNGEDIKTIESEIRNIASLGQPDAIKKLMAAGTDLETIYAPYKRTMAASLGINPETINLDDPTLRMAIGPDKEMSLYDYKKAIRQDNRWKFSQEANDEVTSMINQVKRDFGFMG